MRLFVAIDVPDSIKDHMAFLQRSIEHVSGLRMVHPKNTHLTLNFLGECTDADIDSIILKLSDISFESFTLKLSGIGFFPSRDAPRVCWVGLKDNKRLFSLQKKIDKLFIPPLSFKAHLTLARIRKLNIADLESFLRETDSLKVKPLSFKVTSFKLYKSTLTKVGPIYEVLQTFKAR